MILERERLVRDKINVEIVDITLPSVEEAEKLPKSLRAIKAHWWLRSPGHSGLFAASVYDDGTIDDSGYYVLKSSGVRPALLLNQASSDLAIGDTIVLAGHTWTVISDCMVLCDKVVGHTVHQPILSSTNCPQRLNRTPFLKHFAVPRLNLSY